MICGVRKMGKEAAKPGPSAKQVEEYNWKSWKIRPVFLIPLILLAAILAAILELLVQLSNKPLDSSQLQTTWLNWYANGADIEVEELLPPTLTFLNASTSIRGILTFENVSSIPGFYYFLWIYLPTIVFVLYGMLWETIDAEIKRVEPFYQTSRHAGSLGKHSIFAEYITLPPILSPIQALRWRQWGVFLCALNLVLIGTVSPILQSQLFNTQTTLLQVGYFDPTDPLIAFNSDDYGFKAFTHLDSTAVPAEVDAPIVGVLWGFENWELDQLDIDGQSENNVTDMGIIQSRVYVDPTLSRAQEGVLLLVAITGSALAWLLHTRKSGMKDSYESFAVLASLAAAHDDFLPTFLPLASRSSKIVRESLENRTIHLGWKDSSRGPAYGFYFSGEILNINGPTRQEIHETVVGNIRRYIPVTRRKTFLKLRWAIRLSIAAFLILVIITFLIGGIDKDGTKGAGQNTLQDQSNVALNSTMMTLLISAITKSVWKVVERETRTLWIFRSLHTTPRHAWPAFLRDYTSIPPLGVTFRSFMHGQGVLFFVVMASNFLELSLICFGVVASMTQGQGFTVNGAYANQWTAAALVVAVMIFLPFYRQFFTLRLPSLERNPSSLGMTLSYICASKRLCEDLTPVAEMSEGEREKYLQSLVGQYAFGKVESAEGQVVGIERLDALFSRVY